MKLYHYCTWQGREILPLGVLRPSDKYLPGGPPLVWLTENKEWESCIQAMSDLSFYERGPSNPEKYSEHQIPCWRFEVDIKNLAKLHYTTAGWIPMLKDGIELGSDISQWHWSTKSVPIISSYRWVDNEWRKL